MQEPTESRQLTHSEKVEAVKTPDLEVLTSGEKFSQDLDTINGVLVTLLMDSSIDPAVITYAWNERADITKNFVASLDPTEDNPNLRHRVQFDIMVDTAVIFERVGNQLRYLEKLDDADEFAHKQYLDDVLLELDEELEEKTKELGNSPEELVLKLRPYISFENRFELRELLYNGIDYDDFLGDVYGMILSEGNDPDEVLALLGITE